MQSNFAPVEELDEAILVTSVQGQIPDDFPEGVYIRNGVDFFELCIINSTSFRVLYNKLPMWNILSLFCIVIGMYVIADLRLCVHRNGKGNTVW